MFLPHAGGGSAAALATHADELLRLNCAGSSPGGCGRDWARAGPWRPGPGLDRSSSQGAEASPGDGVATLVLRPCTPATGAGARRAVRPRLGRGHDGGVPMKVAVDGGAMAAAMNGSEGKGNNWVVTGN